ncbi:hypothetical protein B0H13DRAFT_2448994 [Mycena leptocephala]|nr:hypothetical protein B0H13DRAFT_2448994 [Mycena leptocephala]
MQMDAQTRLGSMSSTRLPFWGYSAFFAFVRRPLVHVSLPSPPPSSPSPGCACRRASASHLPPPHARVSTMGRIHAPNSAAAATSLLASLATPAHLVRLSTEVDADADADADEDGVGTSMERVCRHPPPRARPAQFSQRVSTHVRMERTTPSSSHSSSSSDRGGGSVRIRAGVTIFLRGADLGIILGTNAHSRVDGGGGRDGEFIRLFLWTQISAWTPADAKACQWLDDSSNVPRHRTLPGFEIAVHFFCKWLQVRPALEICVALPIDLSSISQSNSDFDIAVAHFRASRFAASGSQVKVYNPCFGFGTGDPSGSNLQVPKLLRSRDPGLRNISGRGSMTTEIIIFRSYEEQ